MNTWHLARGFNEIKIYIEKLALWQGAELK